MRDPANVAASVRQRLLNQARADLRPFNEVLQYYAMERFLHRLSRSDHADRFVLKGALMLRVWDCPVQRPTMDIDLLGRTSNRPDSILATIREIIDVDVEPDGLEFLSTSVQVALIAEHAEYDGVRVRFEARLGTAKVFVQVDIGFGDAVHPAPIVAELPTILDGPAPRLLCYSRESVIAEKFEAMVRHGELNSRMKDFYDLWLLSRQYDFEGATLAEAIRLTFERRGSPLTRPVTAFSPPFVAAKQVHWVAFLRRARIEQAPESFRDVAADLEAFIGPVLATLRSSAPKPIGRWNAAAGWK